MNTDTVGVLIEWLGKERFKSDGREFERLAKNISRTKLSLNMGASYKQLRRQRNELNGYLKALQYANQNANKLIRGRGIDITKFKNDLKSLEQFARSERAIIDSQLKFTPRADFSKLRRQWSGRIGGFAIGLETLGNGISQLANNPVSQVFTGMFRQLGVGLTAMMYEGFSRSVQRFDTFRTFPKIIAGAFKDVDDAQTKAEESLKFLNENVLGLPTGLDAITKSAQMYMTALGDITKGAELAVAANNALLAGQADAREKKNAEKQLRNLIAKGSLNDNQWQSLVANMNLGFTKVGEKLGYKTSGAFYKAIKSKKISGKQFVEALIDVGNEGGTIYDLARENIDTMASSIENIKNAFARLGQGLFKTIDEALVVSTGKSLPQTISLITKQIDYFAEKAQSWVRANPEQIKKWVDTIKSIDIEGFLKGFGQGVISGVKALMVLAKIIAGNERTLGKMLGGAPIWGRLVTFSGQMAKGVKGVLAVMPALLQLKMLNRMKNVESVFSGLASTIRGADALGMTMAGATSLNSAQLTYALGKGGALSDVINTRKGVPTWHGASSGAAWAGLSGMVQGKEALRRASSEAAEIERDVAKVSSTIGSAETKMRTVSPKLARFGNGLKAFGSGFSKFAVYANGVALSVASFATILSGGFALDMKLIKSGMKSLSEIPKYAEEFTKNFRSARKLAKSTNFDTGWFIDMRNAVAQIGNLTHKDNGGKYNKRDVEFSDNIVKMSSNLVEVIGSLKTIGETTIGEVDFTNADKAIQAMNEFYSGYGSDWGGTYGKQPENIKSLVDTFAGTVQGIAGIVDNLGKIGKVPKEAISRIIGTKKNDGIIANISKIYDKFTSIYGTTSGSIKNAGKNISGFKKIAEGISDIVSTLGTISTSTKDIGSLDKGAIEKITGLIKSMHKIYVAFNVAFADNSAKSIKGFGEKSTNLKTGVEGIIGIASVLTKNASLLQGFKTGGMGGRATGTDLLAKISDIVVGLKPLAEGLADLPEVSDTSSVTQINNSMTIVSKILNNAIAIQKQIKSANISNVVMNIKTTLTQLARAFGIGNDDMGDYAQFAAMLGMLDSLADSLSRLQATIGGAATKSVQSLVNAFNDVKKAMQGVKNKLNELDSAFSGKGQKWANSIIAGFNAVDIKGSVIATLNSAFMTRDFSTNGYLTGASYASGLASGLRSIGGVGGVAKNLIMLGKTDKKSNGGMVYASKGQFIGFKPKGTDTVPAMLTPGEFVQRKSAVNHFGTRFMEKINSLDLPGALNSLSMRASKLSSPMGSTVVNNVRNNNANVTQHIHTSKEKIAFKHADRYVRAL